MADGWAWQVCVWEERACVTRGMYVRMCAWQGVCACGRGHVWQTYVCGRGMHSGDMCGSGMLGLSTD